MIDIIEKQNQTFWKKVGFVAVIIISLITLIVITVGHLIITFGHGSEIINKYSIQFSITLIAFTYYLFDLLSSKVIKLTSNPFDTSNLTDETEKQKIESLNSKMKEYNNEFKFGLKYMDRPMKYVFIIMFIYALYATGLDFFAAKNVMKDLEVFFGGAIAFELLISSFLWAQTETV